MSQPSKRKINRKRAYARSFFAMLLAAGAAACASAPRSGGDVPPGRAEGSADAPVALEPVVARPAPGAPAGPKRARGGLAPLEAAAAAHVDAHAGEAAELLRRVVDINSGTMNHDGVRQVGAVFAAELDALGFETRWIPMPADVNRAGHLFAERDGGHGKRVLLIGHLDTVYEIDSPFQRFALLENGWAAGPGVADMKGGDVVIISALKALHAVGALEDARIIVAFLGDEEETGDPLSISRRDLIEAAKRSHAALGFEGGVGGPNSATIARRGFTGWELTVTARRGHSSRIFDEEYGAGAIFESARILSAFYDEIRGEENLTFGAGIILGGTAVEYDPELDRGAAFGKTNVIPQRVTVAGDLRALSLELLAGAKDRMRAVVGRSLPHTAAEIRFRDSYPPMAPSEGNRALLSRLDEVSRDLGVGPIEAVDPGRRGAADISFAAQHTAGLGGLGVVGQGAHSTEERVDLSSIPLMAKRAAVLVYRLTREEPDQSR